MALLITTIFTVYLVDSSLSIDLQNDVTCDTSSSHGDDQITWMYNYESHMNISLCENINIYTKKGWDTEKADWRFKSNAVYEYDSKSKTSGGWTGIHNHEHTAKDYAVADLFNGQLIAGDCNCNTYDAVGKNGKSLKQKICWFFANHNDVPPDTKTYGVWTSEVDGDIINNYACCSNNEDDAKTISLNSYNNCIDWHNNPAFHVDHIYSSAGPALKLGEWLINNNCNYRFVLQGGQNLVLYRNTLPSAPNQVLWSADTQGSGANILAAQGDGNLVLYDSNMNAICGPHGELCNSAEYPPHGPYKLWISDSGIATYTNALGKNVWTEPN